MGIVVGGVYVPGLTEERRRELLAEQAEIDRRGIERAADPNSGHVWRDYRDDLYGR